MVRTEFEAIWSADKSIVQDVEFKLSKDKDVDVYEIHNVEVLGTGFDSLVVNMSYECDFGGLVCNFTLKGVGAIHRYCLGGTVHGDAGRFHQHLIKHGDCVRRGLPVVVNRDDLKNKSVEERWRAVCDEANISFTGQFFAPEVKCK